MNMAVSENDYNLYKEYWDYQRKKEYNKEKVFYMAEKFDGKMVTDFGVVPFEELKQMMWSKINPKDYDEPPRGYVPENEDYRLWNEDYKNAFDWKKVLDATFPGAWQKWKIML